MIGLPVDLSELMIPARSVTTQGLFDSFVHASADAP